VKNGNQQENEVPLAKDITDVKLMFPSKYLRAADLRGCDVSLTISKITRRVVRGKDGSDERLYIVHFKEMQGRAEDERKVWILSAKCNADMIASMHGGNPHGWFGKRITLYPTPWRGEQLAIRVRPTVPQPSNDDMAAHREADAALAAEGE